MIGEYDYCKHNEVSHCTTHIEHHQTISISISNKNSNNNNKNDIIKQQTTITTITRLVARTS